MGLTSAYDIAFLCMLDVGVFILGKINEQCAHSLFAYKHKTEKEKTYVTETEIRRACEWLFRNDWR